MAGSAQTAAALAHGCPRQRPRAAQLKFPVSIFQFRTGNPELTLTTRHRFSACFSVRSRLQLSHLSTMPLEDTMAAHRIVTAARLVVALAIAPVAAQTRPSVAPGAGNVRGLCHISPPSLTTPPAHRLPSEPSRGRLMVSRRQTSHTSRPIPGGRTHNHPNKKLDQEAPGKIRRARWRRDRCGPRIYEMGTCRRPEAAQPPVPGSFWRNDGRRNGA